MSILLSLKNNARSAWSARVVIAILIGVCLVGCEEEELQCPQRSTPDGSAKWALAIAQPLIAEFSPDAEVYVIWGGRVCPDGRLPANTGYWMFSAWSPSGRKLTVTVSHDGSTKTRKEDSGAPTESGKPLPEHWVDSTVVFDATAPHRGLGVQEAVLVAFNHRDYSAAPGEAVWHVLFHPSEPHLVQWNGTYLGPP